MKPLKLSTILGQDTGLDEAAIAAVKKTKFIPAKQRDRDVGVYVVIPIIFRLQGRP
jgi:protein TonB